ncbi:ATP-binding cassette domain-containing protein [Fournierella sp.]|uniref:ABC transporter permease subunit n=1 Tax=Allofournierella sp. TaxID=1940256 RepID=UPI0025C71389|nr:ATP-binding cassette domain-containing protein [Fournierella sp.]
MLELKNIYKTFNPGTVNEKRALQGLNLSLADGDFVTVIGGNGAGKSTMLNIISGAYSVDEGSISIGGVDVTRLPEYKRAPYIGRVFQDPMMGTAATIGALYWFFGTEQGCAVRATGANPNMARAQGINTNFTTVLGLMLSNGLVALSAALLAQYQGFADVQSGRGAIVIGLAAVIIGEVLFSKIFRNFALKLLAVVFGSLIYYLVYQVVILLGLKSDDMKLITALIVALFLAVPYWKGRYFAKRTGKGAGSHA